tara:strand:+ start:3016 stop:3219 length:204 start_codon:yes stop_codon:yes gene_type:complete
MRAEIIFEVDNLLELDKADIKQKILEKIANDLDEWLKGDRAIYIKFYDDEDIDKYNLFALDSNRMLE